MALVGNGRALIFDNLVSDFEHDIGVWIRFLFGWGFRLCAGLRRDKTA
jgi:hypothetical protein